MASSSPIDPEREYRLIEQLEIRIASANTEEKFQSIIQKFLAALLLKLASETARNRNLAIKVCQHVSQRLKLDPSIALPLPSLLKTFREAENAFVKRFTLIFIEQGLARLSPDQALSSLPEVLQSSIPSSGRDLDAVNAKIWSVGFGFLLDMLRTWNVPNHATKEEAALQGSFHLSRLQCTCLSDMLCNFISCDPKTHSFWKPISTDFEAVFETHIKTRTQILAPIAKFLFTSIFDDEQRFAPAVFLSISPSDSANSIADVMFKQCNFDLENDATINTLFDLFDLEQPKLQTKVLSLLSRSQKSTERAAKILRIVEEQLFRDGAGLEAAKLRSAVFTYLTWAVRISSSLSSVKDRLQSVLKEFIELQGWPLAAEATSTDIDLRSKAYESIGLLASIKTSDSAKDDSVSLDLITWLFTSLRCDTTRDVRASIDESLGRILNVTAFSSREDIEKVTALLLWNVRAQEGEEDPTYFLPSVNSTRYIALRFGNKCLPFNDVNARYMNVLALGYNDRREVIEEATRGLDPYWHMINSKLSTGGVTASKPAFPDFTKFMSCVFSLPTSDAIPQQQQESLSASVVFARNLLINQALETTEFEVGCQAEWSQKLQALITNEPKARRQFKNYLTEVDNSSLVCLIENSIIGTNFGSYDCATVSFDLVSLSLNQSLKSLRPKSLSLIQKSTMKNAVQGKAARVFGIVASLSDEVETIITESLSRCSTWSTAVGENAQSVQASLLCAGYTLTRVYLRGMEIDERLAIETYQLARSIIMDTNDKALRQVAYSVLSQMCLCLPKGKVLIGDVESLRSKIVIDAKKEDEMAVTALGRVFGMTYTDEADEEDTTSIEQIFSLHEVRKAEFQFTLGESLATAALGFKSAATIAEFDVDAQVPEWGFHPKLFSGVIERLISDCKTTKPSLKKASAIWLLSLVQYCSDATLVQPYLRDCQGAFARLLNDRDEVVQETGSRGLGLVYEKGDKSLRDDLVRDLVQSFTGGSAKMSGAVTEDTQLFDAGALPTEGGQSVQTYKDIVSLATEMGDPSLVYRFMNLASNNAIWSSRAAFGRFGLSGILADSTYLTENKKFYPKLFRYRFDPNPAVQRSMEDIWRALVKNPTEVIEQNFDLIITDLLKSVVSGKDWRAREASCAAIADLVQGREIEKFEKYLDDIWTVAFKVLDDVKETVRVAAMKLCRTLTGMLIRNLEVGQGTTIRATTMMQHAVPFLLDRMDSGAAQEVQQYAVITLLEVVKKSPPKSLQPFAPEILERLILSLSSLEHESINYLHLNADKYGLTAEKLDKMRVSSINASPVSDAIEHCLESVCDISQPKPSAEGHVEGSNGLPNAAKGSVSPLNDAMQRLAAAYKTTIGLPSKVGLSRVMINLVVRHHAVFRPYAGRFIQLTRKYILDRNATISVSFSTALGYLMRLASEQEVSETSRYAQKLYFESQELAHRAVAGEMIQAISKASNDVFMNYAAMFLPFAFVGQNDLDAHVRDCFEPAWKDNVGGSRALNLYLSEIVALISKHITSNLWPIRQASCLAVAELISSMDGLEPYSKTEAQLLWSVVEESLNGKTWSGKEKVILAYPKFVKRASSIWSEKRKQMKTIALREAKRTNAAYRPHALVALGEVASSRPDLELETEALGVLTNVVEDLSEDGDRMDMDGDEEQGSKTRLADATFSAVAKCLFQILTRNSNSQVLDQAMRVVRLAHEKKSSGIDIEIYDGARRYITQATPDPPSSGIGGGQIRNPPTGQPEPGEPEPFAGFLQGLVLALFADDSALHTSHLEAFRKSRVGLAMALAESGHLTHPARQTLVAALSSWVQGEKSRPLKMELEKAIKIMVG